MCHALLPDPEQITLQTIQIGNGFVTFQVQATDRQANCPQCGAYSDRVHSRYVRTLQDLPWQGNPVRFQLTLRKFFCDNQACTRKIFAQPLPKIARRYQRKTTRLESILLQMLWKVGASDAFYIANLLGLLLSDDALLYQFKKAPDKGGSQTSPAEIGAEIGIDDFAFRKGQSYGSILIDLKTSTPDKHTSGSAARPRESDRGEMAQGTPRCQTGAKVVSRDRSPVYADAIRAGAPEAVQVADRFHLLKNLMEVLEKMVGRESKAVEASLLPTEASMEDTGPVPLSRQQQERKERTRQRRFERLERWQKAHELLAQGYAKKEIARQMGVDIHVDIHTVRTYLGAAVFPERQQRYSPEKGSLAPYKAYLERRWQEGCQNALELFREVKAQGFYERPKTAARRAKWK